MSTDIEKAGRLTTEEVTEDTNNKIMLERIMQLIGSERGETKALGLYLKLSPNTISDWKSGRVKSYPRYASQIAGYYGVSLDWLSGKTDIKNAASNNTDDTTLEMFKEIISQLSDDDVAEVLRYARFRLNSSLN